MRTRQQYYTDRDGNPMDLNGYTTKYSDKSYTEVKHSRFKSGWRILTKWMGYDELAPSGRFLFIYVTFVIDPYGRHTVIQRYATDSEASEGHAGHVARWKSEDRRKKLGLNEKPGELVN